MAQKPLFPLFTSVDTPNPTATRLPLVVNPTGTVYADAVAGDSVVMYAEWTGTLTGTFTLWETNKERPNLANDADWSPLTATFVQPAGAPGNTTVSVADNFSRWKRVKYVHTSGTGLLKGTQMGAF